MADVRYAGSTPEGNLGRTVAGAGDVDGDGLGDVVFSSLNGDVAYLVRGPGAVALQDADTVWSGAYLGRKLEAGDDYNGDGLDDVAMGMSLDVGAPAEGAVVRVFAGEADGTLAPFDQPAVGLTHDRASEIFGATLTYGVTWVDGTLVVDNYEAGPLDWGAMVWLLPDPPATGELDADAAARLFGPRQTSALYAPGGQEVRPAGDTDGDGVHEVLVYASEYVPGNVYAAPIDLTSDLLLDAAVPRITSDPGIKIVVVGPLDGGTDVTGDGLHDVLVGTYDTDENSNAVMSMALLDGPIDGQRMVSASVAVMQGRLVGDLGIATGRFAGDVNGDGFTDLIAGARGGYEANTGGVAAVFLGPHAGTRALADADVLLLGEANGAWAGYSVDGAGDLDGDGLDDLIVGSPELATTVDGGGAVYLLFGATLFP